MSDQSSNQLYPTAKQIAAELDFQFSLYPSGTQLLAFPPDHSIHLRFALTGGAALAIAVEIVDQNGTPSPDAPNPPIWLLPLDLSTEAAARQIQRSLIDPCQGKERLALPELPLFTTQT